MLLGRWKSACAKLQVAMCDICGYDTEISGGGRRRSLLIGEVKCIRNSLLSHSLPSFWLDVTRRCKLSVLVPLQALSVHLRSEAILQRAPLSVADLPTVRKVLTADITNALSRNTEILKRDAACAPRPFLFA